MSSLLDRQNLHSMENNYYCTLTEHRNTVEGSTSTELLYLLKKKVTWEDNSFYLLLVVVVVVPVVVVGIIIKIWLPQQPSICYQIWRANQSLAPGRMLKICPFVCFAGERGDCGEAGGPVPSHCVQHGYAGLQENPGESLSNGLEPQHIELFVATA